MRHTAARVAGHNAVPGLISRSFNVADSSSSSSSSHLSVRSLRRVGLRFTATFRASIKLVRHGESMANTGDLSHLEVGDHNIPLTVRGRKQASNAGTKIGSAFIDDCLIFCSPYLRTQQTLEEILVGSGAQDPRLVDFEEEEEEEEEEDIAQNGHTTLQAAQHNGGARTTDRPPRPYRIREDPRLRFAADSLHPLFVVWFLFSLTSSWTCALQTKKERWIMATMIYRHKRPSGRSTDGSTIASTEARARLTVMIGM